MVALSSKACSIHMLILGAIFAQSCGNETGNSWAPDSGAVADSAHSGDTHDCADCGIGDISSNNDVPGDSRVEPELFSHEVRSYDLAGGLAGISTGTWADPSHVYEKIVFGDKYRFLLSFRMTPMMPPWRRAEATPGPLALYNEEMDVVIVSPMDNFFVSILIPSENQPGVIELGLNGEVDQVPAGTVHRFLIVRGHGMAATFEHWGNLMLADRNRQRVDRYADRGLSQIGYWTDNGAYYYYRTEADMNEEDTLLAVGTEAKNLGISYGYMQLDSWWYFKAEGSGFGPGGLLKWEPIPEMFPNGLAAFSESLGLPLVLHNRWFSPESSYLEAYEFGVEGDLAFPMGPGVFAEFAANAADWGALTYEQDWLTRQYWDYTPLRAHWTRGSDWMQWMDEACSQNGLTMQLCMACNPHVLSSLDMQTATTMRTSIDYAAGISKESFWPQFHIVNMVAWALGIWPFKDNFHSSEKHGEAEALISAMSGGMVGLGDQLGKVRKDIVDRTCLPDGTILKPHRPALPLDAMFLEHSRPFTAVTYSQSGEAGNIYYVSAFNIASEHPERTPLDKVFADLQYDDLPISDFYVFPKVVKEWSLLVDELGVTSGEWVVMNWRTREVSLVRDGEFDLDAQEHLYDWQLFVVAPLVDGLAFLGDPGKYVTAADRRFPAVGYSDAGIDVEVAGGPGEVVDVWFVDTSRDPVVVVLKAELNGQGKGSVRLERQK